MNILNVEERDSQRAANRDSFQRWQDSKQTPELSREIKLHSKKIPVDIQLPQNSCPDERK
jgi:hypothetical protein